MTGMTGNVPYYGGRFTPAQAYAASHPRTPPPSPPPPRASFGDLPIRLGSATRRRRSRPSSDLFETGVVSREEYDDLRARVHP